MDLFLRRKLTLRAHGKQVVFIKKKAESIEHVLMKAYIWALYLPEYPDLSIEVSVGDKYKPDVVSINEHGRPIFWGEAGKVNTQKIQSLARRLRNTHFAFAKWNTSLDTFEQLINDASSLHRREAPIDLLVFPADAGERFIDSEGRIHIRHEDIVWRRLN